MPQYLAPGVYIEEVAGAKPIEGVGTATGAFVGIAERGPIGKAMLITNWTQFTDTFGGYIANGNLAYAVDHFFTEGGTRCWVIRTCHYANITQPVPSAQTAAATLMDRATAAKATLKLEASSPGSWGDDLGVVVEDLPSTSTDPDKDKKFNLALLYRGVEIDRYDGVTVESAVGAINARSRQVIATNLASTSDAIARRPALSAKAFQGLAVTARGKRLGLEIADVDATAKTFTLRVLQSGARMEEFPKLKMAEVERRVNPISKYITVKAVDENLLPTAAAASPLPFNALSGGWDGLEGVALKDRATPAVNTLQVSAWQDNVTLDIQDATNDPTNRFKVVVKLAGNVVETFDDLNMASVEQTINTQSALIEVNDLGSATAPPGNRPAVGTVVVPAGLTDADFIGDAGARNGLRGLDLVDDVNIIAIPDRPGDREVIQAAYTYCENRKDCFFVADSPLAIDPQSVLDFKKGQGNYPGNALNSSYAALYYPWIAASDPLSLTGAPRMVPPSGAIVGTYSATDVRRGVWKAPAGTADGYLNAAVGIYRAVTKGEQELLNPAGINVIRSFPGTGIVVWGARTMSTDAEYKYVSVRRLILFIAESIEEGSQWVVFEPNERGLWAKVKRDVTAFLTTVWRDGGLFGATAQEAFFVKIDDENNPPESRDLGRLVIDIGVAPVKPAEFVIFRIAQKTLGAKG